MDDKICSMLFRRSFLRHLSRCLIAVLLMQVALPSLAASGSRSKAAWMEICAASGIQWVKLAQPEGAPADHQSSHAHCLLCASTGAAPDFDSRIHISDELRDEAITLPSQASQGCYAGHSIRSRAPPA